MRAVQRLVGSRRIASASGWWSVESVAVLVVGVWRSGWLVLVWSGGVGVRLFHGFAVRL